MHAFLESRHNCLRSHTILLKKTNVDRKYVYQSVLNLTPVVLTGVRTYQYNLNNEFFVVPDIGFKIKISNFDFTSIDGIINNNKVDNNQ